MSVCEETITMFEDWTGSEYEALVTSFECPPPPPGVYQNPVVNIEYMYGWNLLSLPLEVVSSFYSDLFPTAVAGTLYGFNGTYEQQSELIPGNGYWLNFNQDGTQTITGGAINVLTISLNPGWNLIGGISFETDSYNIHDPEEIIVPGTIYEFNGTYVGTGTIAPGKGYWINGGLGGDITLIAYI